MAELQAQLEMLDEKMQEKDEKLQEMNEKLQSMQKKLDEMQHRHYTNLNQIYINFVNQLSIQASPLQICALLTFGFANLFAPLGVVESYYALLTSKSEHSILPATW